MDRFIAVTTQKKSLFVKHLKSNMDRFIVSSNFQFTTTLVHLKSNMDRFIELPSALVAYIALLFKIQYG